MKLLGFKDSPELSYPAFSEAWRFSALENFFQEDLKPSVSHFASTSHVEISGAESKVNSLPSGVSITEVKTIGDNFWTSLSRAGVKYKISVTQNLTAPLKISINRQGTESSQATLSYLEIEINKGVNASLIQEFRGTTHGHTHSETSIHLEENSFLEHSLSFKEGTESINTHQVKTSVMAHARYEQTIITGESQKTRLDLLTELKGVESFAKLRSLSLLKTKSQVDLHSQIIHHSADTAADQLAKNLLDGESGNLHWKNKNY